ncbi:hypothetical protein HY995_03960 [Candidatus Micrarchaeota archaeon]|nr:hypothetical protein [Candidatus Micrarchaeota archaeon]
MLDKIQPTAQKMGIRTKMQAFKWRLSPQIGWPSSRTITTRSILNFYRYALLRVIESSMKPRTGPVIIAMGGVSRSGKSVVSKRLEIILNEVFGPKSALLLSGDGYFKERRTVEKTRWGKAVEEDVIGGKKIDGQFDNPAASDLKKLKRDMRTLGQGLPIKVALYDNDKKKYLPEQTINPNGLKVVIVEGLYSLHPSIARLADVRLGTIASLGRQFVNRYVEDIRGERKRPPIHVAKNFIERHPHQRAFVLPTLNNAEVLLHIGKQLGTTEYEAYLTSLPYSFQYRQLLKKLGIEPQTSKTLQAYGKSPYKVRPARLNLAKFRYTIR